MRKSIVLSALMLVGTFTFANNSEMSKDFDSCTVTTNTSISAGGRTYNISVTNTANTCFGAWSANESEIAAFERGVRPAQ